MLWTALIFGLAGSFHCIGMCGPIAFMLPVARDNKPRKVLQVSLYHMGRLVAYGFIGLVFGMVGHTLNLFGIQQQISIITGILMIAIILFPALKFFNLKISGPVTAGIGKIKSSMGGLLKKKSPHMFFSIGLLNGFLPCGLVYLAVFGTIAAGDLLNGGLYMFVFGLGTIPLMTSVVYSKGFISPSIKNKMKKVVPGFVIIIGVLFILRGMGLGIPFISPSALVSEITSSTSCH